MDEIEARSILNEELFRYRVRSYAELLSLAGHSETFERVSPSGVGCQIEVQVIFDDESRRTLRVVAAIDDGGWSAMKPICNDFIMAPDGSFVDE
jgi:hypothetical protein